MILTDSQSFCSLEDVVIKPMEIVPVTGYFNYYYDGDFPANQKNLIFLQLIKKYRTLGLIANNPESCSTARKIKKNENGEIDEFGKIAQFSVVFYLSNFNIPYSILRKSPSEDLFGDRNRIVINKDQPIGKVIII